MTLSCNATGNPAPLLSWNKDGFPIGNDSRISFSAGKKQLKITNVNRRDRGEYQCAAINDIGNDISTAATLNVQCKFIIFICTITTVDDILKCNVQTVIVMISARHGLHNIKEKSSLRAGSQRPCGTSGEPEPRETSRRAK